MDGGRDTEIAMGGFQPGYYADGGSLPRGDVRAMPMLWLMSQCTFDATL